MPRIKELRQPSQRIRVGSVVELYPEPIHEGPHPDDLICPQPMMVGRITEVEHHSNNRSWILGCTVDFDDEIVKLHTWASGRSYVRPLGSIRRVVKF